MPQIPPNVVFAISSIWLLVLNDALVCALYSPQADRIITQKLQNIDNCREVRESIIVYLCTSGPLGPPSKC